MLEFRFPDTVLLTELSAPPSGSVGESVLSSHHVVKRTGTFAIDDHAHTVTLEFGGVRQAYLAWAPDAFDDCILLKGSPTAADLTQSWLGQPAETRPP